LFVDNIFLKGMYFVRTIRSPVRSGKLLSIDCPVVPHGYRLLCSKELPGKNYLAGSGADFDPDFYHPLLAETELLYEGQPVALLVGPEPMELAKLEAAILVNAEETEPFERVYAERNITIETEAKPRSGQTSTGQTRLVETFHKTPCAEHNAPECTGAVAFFERERCVIHTSSQWPRHVQRSVAGTLNIDETAVVINRESPGVHFDAKLWYPSLIATQAALAALIMKKPIKLILTRGEERLYSPRRATSEIGIRSTVDENGHILETAVTIRADLGACGFFADEIIDRMALASLSLYRLGTVTLHAKAVGTASLPKGAFSGFGMAQGFFAIERHLMRVTDELHVSPLHWKLDRNIVKQGGTQVRLPIGITAKKHLPLHSLIETASTQSDFGRKWAAYDLQRNRENLRERPHERPHERLIEDKVSPMRGIGLAFAYQGAGLLYHTGDDPLPHVRAVIEDEELVVQCASSKETGLSINLWKEIALNSARPVKSARYDDGGNDWGDDPAVLSRDIAYISELVKEAAQKVSVSSDGLPVSLSDGLSGGPASRSEVRYQSEDIRNWAGKTCDQKAFSCPSLCVAVVEVEIDKVEYKPLVRGIRLCVEGGKILSVPAARNTLTVCAIAALAWAQGKREVPNIKDVPHIEINVMPGDGGQASGLEELAFSTIPAAYTAAISQAANIPFDNLPIRALEIWQALHPKSEDEGTEEERKRGEK
jgi:CO/xanthine dehydrogenase Mo-binding subunit